MMAVSMTVNGEAVEGTVEPRTHLADFLRDHLRLTGTHIGCAQGVCGACTVLVDDAPQRSCITFAAEAEGCRVTTIEGYDGDPAMAELREAFSAHHALQCGFCTPGMLATARDIVLRLGDVGEERIREELSGNLCRCTGYVGIVEAVRAVSAGKAPRPAAVPLAPAARRDAAATGRATAEERTGAPAVFAARPSIGRFGAAMEERIPIAASAETVWRLLSDLHRVAPCLPGAEIETIEGDQITGRVRVALGPVRTAFHGQAQVAMDDAAREGRISGRGRDRGSGSSAEGEAHWRVLPDEAPGEAGSVIVVTLSWRLSGALAQFGRTGLVQDVVRRLAAAFALNLDALVRGEAPAKAAAPLGLFALLWSIMKARLFGRQAHKGRRHP